MRASSPGSCLICAKMNACLNKFAQLVLKKSSGWSNFAQMEVFKKNDQIKKLWKFLFDQWVPSNKKTPEVIPTTSQPDCCKDS